MILAVDIGNSTISLGLFDEDELVQTLHVPTLTADISLNDALLENPLLATATMVGVSSVVPSVTPYCIEVLSSYFDPANVLLLTTDQIPIVIKDYDRTQIGTDRLLSALAAYVTWGREAQRPVITVDFGTATTYNCVNAKGEFLGGAIGLGIAATAQALSERGAQLMHIPVEFPKQVLGHNTVESIQSGVIVGALTSFEGMIARFKQEVFTETDPIVIATGGLSFVLKDHTAMIDFVESYLVLMGINESIRVVSGHNSGTNQSS